MPTQSMHLVQGGRRDEDSTERLLQNKLKNKQKRIRKKRALAAKREIQALEEKQRSEPESPCCSHIQHACTECHLDYSTSISEIKNITINVAEQFQQPSEDSSYLRFSWDQELAKHTHGSPEQVPRVMGSYIEESLNEKSHKRSRDMSGEDVGTSGKGEKERIERGAAPELDYGVVTSNTASQLKGVHGNYHRYYGYRLGRAFEEDPRLGMLERRWFHKKKCLDIGCNEGLVTLSLAKTFGTMSMTGIDLDEQLVKKACIIFFDCVYFSSDLPLYETEAMEPYIHKSCRHLREARTKAIDSYVLSQKGGIDSRTRREAKRILQSLAQTWFVHGNFLGGTVDRNSFDCITAFSVTKWVHLHGGDAGIRHFFSKVRDLLCPGGLFIVEPQSWKSYKSAASKMRKKNKSNEELPADISHSAFFFKLDELRIRPEDFCRVLQEEFSLKLVRQLDPPSETAIGFERSVLVFQKVCPRYGA